MLPEQFFDGSFTLQVDNSIPKQFGAEKIVYAVRRESTLYAAKIFRKVNQSSLRPINREKESRREFDAYQRTANSVISKFVPAPVEMIKENDKDVGLLVAWRYGSPIGDLYHKEIIPESLILDLEQSLLQLPSSLWLLDDSMSYENVCFDGTSLWLAEPCFQFYTSLKSFRNVVQIQMNFIRENFTK